MMWFLISLAIGLAASDKLDRTYLPPLGAQFAGGILGSHDAPLEPPHHTPSGQGPVIGGQGSQPNAGINAESVNFGDRIPKVPVTTTSIAFSQTTTYPPGEGFETTALPINPVTGLPIQFEQGNFPYGPSQTQTPNFGTNIQPGIIPQGSTLAPVNNGSPGYDEFANQPHSQYPGQNVNKPGGVPQIPGSVFQSQNAGQLQYPGGQANTEKQGFLPTGAPDYHRLDQYSGQNIVNPGGVVQIPESVYTGKNQGQLQYPGGQANTGQQGFLPTGAPDNQRVDQYPGQNVANPGGVVLTPGGNQISVQNPSQTITERQKIVQSTGSSINLRPGDNQQGVNYDGSQGSSKLENQNLGGIQPTQTSYQNQGLINLGGIPTQYPNREQNYGPSVPAESKNVYLPGSTPSTIPSSYSNDVSRTPFPEVPSSTSAYSSVGQVYRSERPQAAADRNAVILNYENIRTPNGYSYSFDTSNGIHADESGIVDNGTKAQGSYSYIGDDGKVYSVIYTADENGFQARGDHLPTPPPIPEAIQRVIELAARDKAAGIVHDGSYDEAKYGDHQYQGTKNHRRPLNQDGNRFENNQFNGAKDDLIKPIVGIKDEEYEKDQYNNNLPVSGTRKELYEKIPSRNPSNQRNSENTVQDISVGNVSADFDSPKGDFYGNSMPIIEEVINHLHHYSTKKQGPGGHRPLLNENIVPYDGTKNSNQNKQPVLKNRGPSTRRPISGSVKDITETKYPGSNVDVVAADYSGGDGFNGNESQDNIGSGSPNGSEENVNTYFDKVTGAPIIGHKQPILRQRVKENRTPDSTGNRYTQNKNGRPQGESFTKESTKTPSFSDNLKNAIAAQEAPSNQPDQRRTKYVEDTTRKPFMTPNVYNQNNKNKLSTPNTYNQNDMNGQSTTRRPFTTIGVTSPTDNSYTDYDNGDNYASNQDIGNDRFGSTKKTEDNRVTSRPYQSTQTTSRPQNVPGGQKVRVNQKGTVTPGRTTENSRILSPGYTYGPTTQIPSQNSRFGNTENPHRMKTQQRRPSNTLPDFKTAVGRPLITQSPSETGQSDFKYQTTRPVSRYNDTNVGSGYPTTGSYPGLRSMSTSSEISTPQDYYTSTYGPSQGYSSTTAVPPTSGYTQGLGAQVPSATHGSLQSSQHQTFHGGYHYEPPKSGSLNLDGSGYFAPTGNSGVSATSPTGTYQTTYEKGPGGFPSTTLVPSTPGSQGTFITSQPGTPTGSYQGNYQNGPSTPDYATTIATSTPEGKPVFRYPGSPGVQETTGYEYGPSRPNYSTTDSVSTIGTTPGAFTPSGTTGTSRNYSTIRPGLQTTMGTFVGGPVDGFGRPIIIEEGGSNPGFGHPTQGPTGSGINIGPNFGGTHQSTTYPGSFEQTRVIGEDFSGPKQPQTYDPINGYRYK